MITNTCADCRTQKPEVDYTCGQWVRSSSRCKSCVSDRNRQYQAKNGKAIRSERATYYLANKATILQASKDLRAKRGHLYEPARQAWAKANRDKMLTYFQTKGQQYREWIDSLKAGIPCMDCGNTLPPEAMDFDHVRGTKTKSIIDMWSWARDKVLAPLAKCVLVCANCHRIRTVEGLYVEVEEAA